MHPYIRNDLREIAKRRNAKFVHLARNRPLSKDYEDIGLIGEWEFGKQVGIMPRLEPSKRGGDGGWDFQLPLMFTVDVKTSRKGDLLLVEAGKIKADIYVLVKYEEEECVDVEARTITYLPKAEVVGWCWAANVRAAEPKDTGRGVVNHAVLAQSLRPLSELLAMVATLRGR